MPSHPRGGHTVTTVAPRPAWTLLTNHGHVLLAVAVVPDARVADIAAAVGITTRATLTILHDLAEAGFVRRTKIGRRTHPALPPPHPGRARDWRTPRSHCPARASQPEQLGTPSTMRRSRRHRPSPRDSRDAQPALHRPTLADLTPPGNRTPFPSRPSSAT